jgi:hypothetical protein
MPVFFWTCQALAPLRERPESRPPHSVSSGEHTSRASSARSARPSSVPAGLRPARLGIHRIEPHTQDRNIVAATRFVRQRH